jgi:hypothetical protein
MTARLATASGGAAIASAVLGILFFAVGEPFGHLNDFANAVLAILSGLLAWQLRSSFSAAAGVSGLAIGLALLGAAVAVLGSVLTIGITGWFFAALVSSAGFALIGAWLVAQNRTSPPGPQLPPRLRTLGVVAGVVMTTGILVVPAIAMRLDDANTAPGWIWAGFVGWLGMFVLFPAWAIWLGRVMRQPTGGDGVASGI